MSALGLAVTGLVEMAIAVLGGSVGLLGDALHNLADVSTSAVVFIGFRVSRRQATPSRPYGYERAEDQVVSRSKGRVARRIHSATLIAG